MDEQKGFLTMLAETIDRYRAQKRAQRQGNALDHTPSLRRFLHWMVPNGGTILLVLVLILTQQVWARPLQQEVNVPGPSATTVNYQGRLADAAGNPLDGTYGMSFSLWDDPSAGTVRWGPENHPAVPVSDGLFSVGLGSQTSGGIPTTTWDGDRYLEITVGGETMSPRELIRSVPIAGMALTVPDGAITREKIAAGAAGGWVFFEDNIDLVILDGISNTGDPPWETVQVSNYVPEGAAAVLISVQDRADAADVNVGVRPVGSTGGGGQFWTTTWAPSIWDSASGIVRLDLTRSFQWRALTRGHTITAGTIQLWGYYMPAP